MKVKQFKQNLKQNAMNQTVNQHWSPQLQCKIVNYPRWCWKLETRQRPGSL